MDDITGTLTDQLQLIEALFTIAHESNEAEVVRTAFAALTNTDAGLAYLGAHPIVL